MTHPLFAPRDARDAIVSLGVVLGVCVLALPVSSAQGQQRSAQQVVRPAPVSYWMDVSTGEAAGGGGMAGMLGGMMGGGMGGQASGFGPAYGGRNNWFGAAQTATPGRFTDIAVFDSRRPGQLAASQAVPSGLRMGAALPLLPPPPTPPGSSSPWDDTPREPPGAERGRMPRITIRYFWGCGAAVRQGQPRTVTFDANNMRAYGEFLQGRSERDRGATSNSRSSIWPNRDSNNAYPAGASLAGSHTVTGAGLPASLAFQIAAAQDFMPPLGLSSSGSPSGVVTLSWANLPTATGYFSNATGFKVDESRIGNDGPEEMTMTVWSASETPDPGDGLMRYLSNANQQRFLADRTLLPSGTTSCQIPLGIFADAMMVNIGAIAYGSELSLIHPSRPTNPREPWNQEWTARIRVKSQSSLLLMAGMETHERRGRANRAQRNEPATPQLTEEQLRALPLCRGNRPAEAIGRAVLGRATGGLLGSVGNREAERPGVNCRPQ